MTPATEPRGQPAAAAAPPAQYLTFTLAGEMYGIGILAIKEIIEYRGLTEVPTMPPAVRGVINLRGAVVPVLDPQSRFGLPPGAATRRTCIVIVEIADEGGDATVVGMVVDAVSEVIDIAAADIEPPPPFGARIRADFIQGVTRIRGQFVLLLHTAHLLSMEAPGQAEPSALTSAPERALHA